MSANKKEYIVGYWLMKSEPDVFGIDDLQQRPEQTEPWDGVRNYQARNFMRDNFSIGDLAFFYHSSTKIPGIVGIMKVVSQPYPDHLAFNPESKYYDPKSNPDNPRWFCVDMQFVEKFSSIITLATLKEQTFLDNFTLLKKGSRLSVMPVTDTEWKDILELRATKV